MQDLHSFEYAVIRIVPRVEREEFFNTGVVLYCPSLKFLDIRIQEDNEKLHMYLDDIDAEEVRVHLKAFEEICRGRNTESPIAKLDPASRFRWLTATRSTVVQSSKVHPGLCCDPKETIEKLYREMVL